MDITRMDRFERLAFSGKHCAAIMGNPQTADYELVPLGGDLPGELRETVAERDLQLVAVVGIVDGELKSELAVPLGASTIAALSGAYCKLVECALRARLECDSLCMLYDA
jgi:hypothetical protein